MRRWVPLVLLSVFGCNRGLQGAYDRLPPEGARLPPFEFPSLDGTTLTSSALTGRPVVLALWSTTCGASRQALAAILTLRAEYEPRGIDVILVADDRDPSTVTDVLSSVEGQVPTVLASGAIARVFGQTSRWPWQGLALPSFLVLDANGVVRRRVVGVEADSTKRLDRVRHAVDALAGGRTDPPAA
ncbi:MAG: TlpA family protein disulfide reductase [Gemmatimonadales bacterium]